MEDPIQPERCARLFNALAAPERLRIVRFLRDGPRNVTEIAAMLRTKAVNVSHHMTVLRHAGIVRGRKEGRFVYYALAPGLLLHPDDERRIELLDLGCCRIEMPCVRTRPPEAPSDAGG
jgi:DNA-binding transcriptional ArsR family regulator